MKKTYIEPASNVHTLHIKQFLAGSPGSLTTTSTSAINYTDDPEDPYAGDNDARVTVDLFDDVW